MSSGHDIILYCFTLFMYLMKCSCLNSFKTCLDDMVSETLLRGISARSLATRASESWCWLSNEFK